MVRIKAQFLGNNTTPRDLALHSYMLHKETRIRASRFLRAARAKAAKLKSASQQAGYLHGLKSAELESNKALLEKIMELQAEFKKFIAKANTECLALAISIAERILESEIKTNDLSLATRIATALGNLYKHSNLKIHAHEQNLNQIREALAKFAWDIEFHPCAELEPGSAVIGTSSGSIQISWRNDLEQLAETLAASLSKLNSSPNSDAFIK